MAAAARQFLEAAARRCGGCDGRDDGAVEAMLQCQKVSDLLIASSHLSIPLELFYFASCADLAPLKWLVLHSCAFMVLCGAAHLLAVLAHHHPTSPRLLLALTAAKLLNALASFATALSLPTFIPRLLRLKFRESLRTKARQLHRDLALIRRREEATTCLVRMLTHHIRSSPLHAHTILHTTMLHLADALALRACALWMQSTHDATILHPVHHLTIRDKEAAVVLDSGITCSISADDPDVVDIVASEAAKVLSPGSELGTASGGGPQPLGAVAAIRVPMLKASNFDFDGGRAAGTPEASLYAILVLVLPDVKDGSSSSSRGGWSSQDLEVVQVVADQVAVALSHAAVLEESQSMRDKLAEQHRALLQARHEATMATRASNCIRSAMCGGMRRPLHSIIGMLSMMQEEEKNMRPEQRLVVDAMARTGTLSSTLINDVMETLTTTGGEHRLALERKPFELRAVIREAISVAGCLAGCRGVAFSYQRPPEEDSLPEWVVSGRPSASQGASLFHLLLHMVGTLLRSRCHCCSAVRLSFSVRPCNVGDERYNQDWIPMRPNLSGCNVCVKFQVRIQRRSTAHGARSLATPEIRGLSFGVCNKIVQMMNGNMWSASDSQGLGESITLILQFQLQQALTKQQPSGGAFRGTPPCIPHLNGLRILLADGDDMSRGVTQRLLEKLGCQVMPVSSAAHCLSLLGSADSSFQLVLLDLDMRTGAAAMDGFQAALRIREVRNSSWLLIVVALAGTAIDHSDRDVCQRSRINGLIRKPITLAALGAQLSTVLQNS